MRKGAVVRSTKETSIEVSLDLDGAGASEIATGIGFFDHMLDQLARHSLIDMSIRAEGDRHIDDHHTVEDVGIALGQAILQALGDKRGLTRYADCLTPMDETLTRVALDVSGRPYPRLRRRVSDREDRRLRYATGARILPGLRRQRRADPAYRERCTAPIRITSPNPASRASRGRFARRSASIRARARACPRPRARSKPGFAGKPTNPCLESFDDAGFFSENR